MGSCCSSSDRVEPANTSQIPVYFLAHCYHNGDIDRVLNGYDSCGNVCGKKNARDSTITCLGLDYTDKKFLQINGINGIILNQRNIDRQCVSSCEGYRQLLNRCIPQETKENKKTYFTKTGIPDYLQEVTEDLDICKMEILYLFLISFGFSVLLIIFFRFLAGVVVWVILIGAMITSVAGTVFLWILWKNKKDALKTKTHDVDSATESVTSYLAFAIAATIVTVIIWLVILVMRKRIKLVVQLFKEAGKAISSMPLILFEPILTFLSIGGLIAIWLYFSLWIESAGFLTRVSETDLKYYYKKDTIIKVARWYNLFALFWLVQFCVGCQHMVIAGAVSKWFFTRDRNSMGCPIARSFWNLIRYHLGSVALGSFLIALVQIIRAILKYVESKTKASENAVSRCIFRTCQCCLWCFEKVLQFFSRNAYIEVAMNGYNFCKGGQQAFKLFATNALRVAAINSVGDFVLFLGKAIVVIATVLIGVHMLQDKEEIQHKWIPLALVGLFAYVVSHIFVTVYEMAIDTIFLCFCEDCEENDGLSRPYYMSRGLMEFVQNSKKALSIRDNPRGEAWSSSPHKK
ncbi:Choline transporter-like protein 1 [Gryllus bimaculatus]|nr:Choline transporter-like protein 1 [Gryllus bimaculatus]